MTWILQSWSQIWPNLIASVLWSVPSWMWHHRRIRRLITRELHALTTKEPE